jgi:transposase-like protein
MVRKKNVSQASKQDVIQEYLTTDKTLKFLGQKYGIPAPTIQGWVRAYRMSRTTKEPAPAVDRDLQKLLSQAELKNQLLEEILRIAEEQTGIDFKKKFGARRS